MPNETVLVIDDEQLIRRSITKRLSVAGYQVLEAEDGKTAIERAGLGVDLAILDYRLPDMVHDYLRGISARRRGGNRDSAGRLGVLYSNKDYGCEWDYDWRNKRFRSEDNTRFAVNLVVYTMT